MRLRLFTILSVFAASTAGAADITAYAEEWPPYNFSEGGMAKGISTDFLRAVCGKAGLVCDVHIVPWARGYKLAQALPNTMIFTTARTQERETQFLWIGPILPRQTWIFGHPGFPKISRLADLARYNVAVGNEDAAIADLSAAGVPVSAMDRSGRDEDSFRKFAAKRVAFITGTELGMAWQRKKLDLDIRYEKVLPLAQNGAYFYAMNPQSDPTLVNRLQAAINELKATGRLKAISAHYLASSHDAQSP
jgi:polar amino acid transport system substrate-binding protein